MKKAIVLLVLTIMLTPLAVSAYSIKKGDSVYVPKDETIEGNLYAVGSDLTIEGKVTGDVICAGQLINISGEVDGDVICAGQSMNINGKIGGNMRVIGNTINFSGQVARNAITVGATIITSSSSTIGWDFFILGNIFELRGDVGRDLYGGAGKVNLSGQVGKDVNLNFGGENNNANPLVIAGTAAIGGDVNYTALNNALAENETVVKGKINHSLPKITAKKSNFANLAWWWGNLIAVFSALVIGLVLISFWREPIIKTTDLMLNKASASLGWGILGLLLTPIIVIILLVTIIGIPLSLILMALWLIALYISKVLVGILLGRSLLNNLLPKRKDSLILGMIVGIVAIYLIFSIPFIGHVASLLAMLWGLGGIMLALKKT